MSLRRQKPSDSLDLLLDTMCNTFGGIVLLAILVTLLSGRERSARGEASDTTELLLRRVALAEKGLEESRQFNTNLVATAGDPETREQFDLLRERLRLQTELQALRQQAEARRDEIRIASVVDPTERLRELRSRMAAMVAARTDGRNRLAAIEQETRQLLERREALQQQVQATVSQTVQQLRFPRERPSEKRGAFIIARYGGLYPCQDAELNNDKTRIRWETFPDHEKAHPIEGLGLDPERDAAILNQWLRRLRTEQVYVIFLVYEDSFSAFIRGKRLVVARGLEYGWEPLELSHGPAAFSASYGTRPNPQ